MLSQTRPLPEKLNPLLTREDELPNYSDLVGKRRLHQSVLRDPNVVLNYVYLGVPIPRVVSGVHKSKRDTHYLMRRSGDGFVSATAMFKATFPWASIPESDSERDYVRRLPGTSEEETAGNVWVTPAQALKLAQEYRIKYWIRALLDPARYTGNRTAPDGNTIPSPPKFNLAEYDAANREEGQESSEPEDSEEASEEASDSETVKPELVKEKPRLAPPTPPSSFSRTTRSRRSVSPQKSRRAVAAAATPRTRSSARIRAQSKEPSEEPGFRQPSFRDDVSIASTAREEDEEVETTHVKQEVVIETIEEEENTIEVTTKEEESETEVEAEAESDADVKAEADAEVKAEADAEAKAEAEVEGEEEAEEEAEEDEEEEAEKDEEEAEEEAKAEEEAETEVEAEEETDVATDTEPQATIHIHKEVVVDETTGERTETSRVELEPPLPMAGQPPSADEVAQMLEHAKVMVGGQAIESDGESEEVDAETTPTRSRLDRKSKRRVEQISKDDEDDEAQVGNMADKADEQPRAKRAKVEEAVAIQIKKRHIRKRALFGIGMTVAIGALSTWATAIF